MNTLNIDDTKHFCIKNKDLFGNTINCINTEFILVNCQIGSVLSSLKDLTITISIDGFHLTGSGKRM